MDAIQRLRDQNEKNRHEELSRKHRIEDQISMLDLRDTVLQSFKALVDYMDGKVSKVAVTNQLKDYATTDDVTSLVSAIDSLHETTKTHENADFTPVVEVLTQVLDEAKQIPKDKVEIQLPESKDYTKQLKELTSLIDTVNESIKSQETTVEAPVVNVEAPNVQVDAPDLAPITKDLDKSFKEAIKGIVIPSYKTDNTGVEKILKQHTNLLKDIRDEAGKGGGSTGGGLPIENGAVKVSGTINATPSTLADFSANDIDTTNGYFGMTKPDGTWLVLYKTDTSVSYATVTNNVSVTSYTDAWTNKETLTYGRFDEAF